MQQELLLEFFSEEIPARFQKKAIVDAKEVFTKILKNHNAEFAEVDTFVSPRRLTIRVSYLSRRIKDRFEEKRGPKISAPEKAISGFLKANGKEEEDLIEKDGYYYLNLVTRGVETVTIISDLIEEFIENMPWKKSMRWYLENEQTLSAFWVRPIRSILCIYSDNFINTYIKSVGLNTCDYTYGHRFLSSEKIRVFDFEDYKSKLEKNYVILDFSKKRDYIERELVQKAAAIGLCLSMDDDLLDEVAGLVEYPFIHIGIIDEKFMKLPPIVLSTSMRVHQKYFTLTYSDSIIAPFFGTVTNIPGTETMYIGLDRVLRARLSDAAFFYKEDTEVTLEAFTQRLSNVIFHEKLGSMAQKVDRMMSIADTKEEHRAVALCKADLLTQMVSEFPELQGFMGEIYAKVQDESPEVCVAIREHYKPLGANDNLPETKTGARVAFFDKIDTLVGFLGTGIYPTGSKDPFALRRAALSIVRLICDSKKDILAEESLSWYIETLINSYSEQGIALDPETLIEVEKFIIERLKAYMADKLGIEWSIVDSVIASFDSLDFNYKYALEKAQNLSELSKLPEFQIVKDAYKRAKGVVSDSKLELINSVKELDFKDEHMLELRNLVSKIENNEDIDLEELLKTSQALLNSCENVLINDPDISIREKNLKLFSKFIHIIDQNIGSID